MNLRNPITNAPLPTAVDTICAHWRAGGATSRNAGTGMHDTIELRCNWHGPGGVAPSLGAQDSIELRQFAAYAELRRKEGWVPYRTEQRVFDGPHQLAGAVDMQWMREDGERTPEGALVILLADWKRSDKLSKPSYGEKGLGPLSAYDACPASEYSLQLGLYRWVLERHHGVHVARMEIVAMHPNMEAAQIMEATMPRDVIDAVMQVRAEQVRTGETIYKLRARLEREALPHGDDLR